MREPRGKWSALVRDRTREYRSSPAGTNYTMVEKNAGWELMSLSNTMWSASHRQIIAMPSCLLSQALTRSVILNRAYSKIEDGPGLMGDTSDIWNKGGGLLNNFFFFCRKQSLISL